MKVLIVSHAYVEAGNRQKLELLSQESGMEIGVIYPRKWRTWHGEDKNQKSKIKNQNLYREFVLDTFSTGDGGKYFYHPIQLIISILKFRPDLIHVEEEPFSFVSCQLSVVSWLLRTRLTFFTWENMADLKLGFLRGLIEKIVFWVGVAAAAGTNGAKERLEKRGFNKRIEIIPQFGVDTQVFYALARPRLANGVVMGFVGRPTLSKGIDVLLEALSKLPENYRLLWVTSSASIPSVIADQVKTLGIGDRTRIEMSVPHKQLAGYYRQMDIYVLPSRTTSTWKEQFGRTALEAMACGVPVVGSSSGAIPEVLGEAGLIFEEGKADDLAEKIESLSKPPLRDRLVEKSRRLIEESFSSEKVAGRQARFFEAQGK